MGDLSPSIAIVDDDPLVLKALARLFRSRGYRSRAYQSAKGFLVEHASESPDCLIVDLQMPEMSGLELHTQLSRSGIKIPTIVITASTRDEDRERCEQIGVVAFLVKPLQEDLLFAAVEAAVQCRRGEL
jgi:FixJ family two-component response regulator